MLRILETIIEAIIIIFLGYYIGITIINDTKNKNTKEIVIYVTKHILAFIVLITIFLLIHKILN